MQGQSSRPDVVDTTDRPSFVNPSEMSIEVHNLSFEMERKRSFCRIPINMINKVFLHILG